MKEGGCLRSPARPRAGLMLLLLLSCSPRCCRGVDWRGLGCTYEMEINSTSRTRSRCCATHPFLFLFARHVVQVQLEEGGRAGCADAGSAGTGWGGAVALCERWRMI